MGGERFEVNDPNYLFGDNCDLNFLTCNKPYSLPYKKAQQSLLSNLNTKQKAINKVSSRMSSLSSPFNILTGRHRQISQSHKQDAQTQTLNNTKGVTSGHEPSQPLVMLIHIRKETLRLIKTSNIHNIDSDQNSPTNTASISNTHTPAKRRDSSSITSDSSSSAHSTITSKSGYTSVRDVPPSECASDENDECYQDALNEPTNLSMKGIDDDNESNKIQQQTPHHNVSGSIKEDIRITIDPETDRKNDESKQLGDINHCMAADKHHSDTIKTSTQTDSKTTPTHLNPSGAIGTHSNHVKKMSAEAKKAVPDQIYNIEFMFDSEVDCSIRVFYFCTRDVTSNNVSYKPQHATYKSKTYTYRKGLNQKFEQHEHTFQPYLFDEDLLIYKPLDLDGNYNSGAVFPIVIHCAALEGPNPRQSQSLVATVEKSQLDDSYSIKPLKQLLFVDGVQYILQDIYGIENKSILTCNNQRRSSARTRLNRNFRSSCGSLYSSSNLGSHLNLSETASIGSVVDGSFGDSQNRDSLTGTTFECVICMSDERDTMLLPCRHLCLCNSCAQSLRYQASSCPICRCPFKAALNIRVIQRDHRYLQPRSWSTSETSTEGQVAETNVKGQTNPESMASSATPLLSQTRSSLAGGRSSSEIRPHHPPSPNANATATAAAITAPVDGVFLASQNNSEASGASNVHGSSILEMQTLSSGNDQR